MNITPVTTLPANGVTSGALQTTTSKARFYVKSSTSAVNAVVIRMLENGDWVKTDKVIELTGSGSGTMDLDVLDSGEYLHVLLDGAASTSGVTATLKSLSSPTSAVGTRTLCGHVLYLNPAAGSTTGLIANADIANGAQTLVAQPDFPRKVQIVVTDANSSITAGTIAIVGVGARGQALSQTFNIASGGTKTYTTADAYATVTSVIVAGLTGALAGTDKINAGFTNDLGLPAAQSPTPSSFAVYKEDVDNANEAVGTVDATAGTVAPTTTPNGTHDFDFWYQYSLTF